MAQAEKGPGATEVPPWGPPEQRDLWQRVGDRRESWDLVVVGAGITGAGVALDAALRGLKVLVIEAKDVAFGTSSRSTRLIHGGVRYLEQAELGLVHEALRERTRLLRNASHLVKPARFLFPSYRGDRLGPWRLRLGLTLYDVLANFQGTPHEYLPAGPTLDAEPLLAATDLRGAVLYDDAITDDARLTLTVLQEARRHGAAVLTHARVESVVGGEPCRITIEGGHSASARACVVATGPWTGPGLLGPPGRDLLSLSKGIHLVLSAQDVAVRRPLVLQARDRKRIMFVVPWGQRTYVGTTDDPYDGDPGQSGVEPHEEEQLLASISDRLPGARLHPNAIVSAWSGVRPLVRPRRGTSGRPEEVSRRHDILTVGPNVLAVVGGKLTTYRAMAEEIVDRVLAGWPEHRFFPCSTADHALISGRTLTAQELADPLLSDLAPRHGVRARTLAERARQHPDLAQRLVPDLPYRWVEIERAIAYEGCVHVVDVLRRRLPLALTDARRGGGVVHAVARWLVDAQGGSAADIDREIEQYRGEVERETRRPVMMPSPPGSPLHSWRAPRP